MVRIMGLDLGSKTIGVAVSDEMGWIAQGVGVIRRVTLEKDLLELKRLIEKYQISEIVMGIPLNMDGSIGSSAENALKFAECLREHFDLPVHPWDERLSTVAAERVLLEADMSRAKRRKVVDQVAAQMILQGYLDYRAHGHHEDHWEDE